MIDLSMMKNLTEAIKIIEDNSRIAQCGLDAIEDIVKPNQWWRFPSVRKQLREIQEQVQVLKEAQAELEKARS